MTAAPSSAARASGHWQVRLRGTVQGVGFRPAIWRLAESWGLRGEVENDGDGVLVRIQDEESRVRAFADALAVVAPPLARVASVEVHALPGGEEYVGFRVAPTSGRGARTPVAPDAAACEACLAEVQSPLERRHRYPFTSCTHCGPRYSIVTGIPYDRANTSMAAFPMCAACRAEYEEPGDRRFHAQPVACHACGPRAWLVRADGTALSPDRRSTRDDVDAAAELIGRGEIVAIRGIGGFHLACDATDAAAVERLRARKRRDGKPFALMARDLDVVRSHCRLHAAEEQLLRSSAAPIVLLDRLPGDRLPDAIAPGLATLGFMLPTMPLHALLLRRFAGPVVMTSGNRSQEPQVTGNSEVLARLGDIADYALLHDREVVARIDDSVVRLAAGRPRILRRARGYAPSPLPLPPGFEAADGIVAFGGELKATFCLVSRGSALVSPHQGDLEEVAAYEEYVRQLDRLAALFEHRPLLRAADRHPGYLSGRLARERCRDDGLPLVEVQHHHAHVAACLAENGVPLATRPLLGIVLDGLGLGDDGTFWGGEFLLAGYRGYRRLGTFKPVPMIGGAQAIREPWRSTYAHLVAALGWSRFTMEHEGLELHASLAARPRAVLDRMLETGTNCPVASSCGRLFDAVAAAMGLRPERVQYEGQAAMELEAAVDPGILEEPLAPEGSDALYPFSILRPGGGGLPSVEPLAMWQALLGDLRLATPRPTMAARFHRGLARVIARMAAALLADPVASGEAESQVALSGGCFQNRILLELTVRELQQRGIVVHTHASFPANDGSLALGQAAVAAAIQIQGAAGPVREEPCA